MNARKDRLVRNARQTFKQIFPERRLDDAGLCLLWAATAVITLDKAGLQAHIEAGSMNWPIVRPEQDDGVSPTHFSYQYEPNHPLSRLSVAMGQLPEMHVWAAIPKSGEIAPLGHFGVPPSSSENVLPVT